MYTSEVIHNQTLFKLGEFHLSVSGETAFAIVLAQNGFLVALFTVYITRVMTRFKESKVFITSSIFYACGISLYGFTQNIWMFFLAMALFTLGELMVVGIQESFVAKLAPEDMRGQYFSAASLRFTVGKLIAPLSLVLTNYLSYSIVFMTLGILALISAYVYYVLFKKMEQKVNTTAT
ncbi:MFS transporter [Aquibacillus koreensis]|uniref:MFS transporter n=1 Tax=Aquibacillus koreensis TaxID=279446 RepID=UPI002882D8F2|nr:MFS transporter [Aquibacillus koreensis]